MRAPLRTALVVFAVLLCAPAVARADTTIDFEQPGPGTQITNQYADAGGPGQGVVFGQLPKGDQGLLPVIKSVGAGTANSGTQVADISQCFGCENYHPSTTGTFQVPRSKVSVDVGYDGLPVNRSCLVFINGQPPDFCAYVTLTAYDSSGDPIGTPSSSYVRRGDGYHTLLSVQVSSEAIIGFRISARTDGTDNGKPIAIDDLSFDVPMTPPPPDFSVTPTTTSIVMGQGETFTDAVKIGRLSGSSGPVQMSLAGDLPAGVTASFDPNPATGSQSNLILHANADAVANGFDPITLTITGTPMDAGAGPGPRSAPVTLQVRSSFDVRAHNGQTDVDLSGCSVDVPIEVDREFSFPGPVALRASGLPAGVQASFAPSAQATFPNGARGQIITMTVRAAPTGLPIQAGTFNVIGSAPPLGDRTITLSVHGTCPQQYDTRVTSLQITQGVQADFLPAMDPARHPPNQFNYDQIPGAAKLHGGGPTVVRVYADEAFGPSLVPGVPAVLYGSSYDRFGQLHPLPGSPLLPVSGTRDLHPGPATATEGEAFSEKFAYSFVLPPAWTHGEIAVNAILQPATGSFVNLAIAPCTTDVCAANDSMGLTHIPFLEAPPVTIRPVALTVSGRPALPDPQEVFKFARVVTPLDLAIQPYAGTVDITDLAHTFDACTAAALAAKDDKQRRKCSDDANGHVAERMDDWTCDNGTPDQGWNIGVNTDVARGLTKTDVCIFEDSVQRNAVVEAKRPLTSVGHEFFHLLGRVHASFACGSADGGGAESWPPDGVGFINGIGLDTLPNSGINGGPFAVIAGTPPRDGCNAAMGECGGTRPPQRFDLMSYCASDGPNPVTDGNAWVSVRNWNAVFEDHRFHKPVVEARATGPPSLRVGAFAAPDGSATITSVTPLASGGEPASTSAYHLVGTNGSGQVLADVPMVEAAMHVDGEQPPVPLVGVIPSAGVESVVIVKDGATLAGRARSAHPPTIAIKGKPAVSKGKATVRWSSGDADGNPREATVDYSSDGGKSFRRIFIGPDKHSARVPARYLSRSSNARVRVTVNDGFQATSATSAGFRAPGAPPEVSILSPASGYHQPNDAALVLSGQAFDDSGKMLAGKQLSWRMGHRVLGSGHSIAASGLPSGRRQITLVARDHLGRTGRRSIAVVINGARPIFLTLKAPGSVTSKARSLRLKVSTSLPARLLVRGSKVPAQGFSVGRKARTVSVRVARGAGRLTLRLRLTSGGKSSSRTVLIRRK